MQPLQTTSTFFEIVISLLIKFTLQKKQLKLTDDFLSVVFGENRPDLVEDCPDKGLYMLASLCLVGILIEGQFQIFDNPVAYFTYVQGN